MVVGETSGPRSTLSVTFCTFVRVYTRPILTRGLGNEQVEEEEEEGCFVVQHVVRLDGPQLAWGPLGNKALIPRGGWMRIHTYTPPTPIAVPLHAI